MDDGDGCEECARSSTSWMPILSVNMNEMGWACKNLFFCHWARAKANSARPLSCGGLEELKLKIEQPLQQVPRRVLGMSFEERKRLEEEESLS
jgi:hypothetical protein